MSKLVDDIHAKANIIDVCKRMGVNVRQMGGGEYKALCPLHDEDTPSFNVNPDKGLFYCFGCGRGGDVIELVKETLHLSFAESLAILAEWFDIEYEENDLNFGSSILKTAISLFAENAEEGVRYLEGRGISRAVQELYGPIGYAQKGYASKLVQLGVPVDDMHAIGLLSESGTELFAGYTIIPLRNAASIPVAISGRATHQEQPKYMTTHRSTAFNKTKFLFGADVANESIRNSSTAYIVEGQIDVMSMHEAGARNTVSILGSNVSIPHMIAIKRMGADNFIIVGDGDAAGLKFIRAVFNIGKRIGMNGKAILLGRGEDPNSLLRAGSLQDRLQNPISEAELIVALAGESPENAPHALGQLLRNMHPYDPAFAASIELAADKYNLDKRRLKSYVMGFLNEAQQNRITIPQQEHNGNVVFRALTLCPTTGSLQALSEVVGGKIIEAATREIPIENGEACDSVLTLVEQLKRALRMQQLADLKSRAADGDVEAIKDMLAIQAESQGGLG